MTLHAHAEDFALAEQIPWARSGMTAKRIVVVDDEPWLAEVLATICRKDGHHVNIANSVEQAFALTVNEIDIMIVDLQMPGANGMELLRWLADQNYAGKIIIVSGADERLLAIAADSARRRGIKVLGSATKPVSAERLRRLLATQDCEVAGRPNAAVLSSCDDSEGDIIEAITSGAMVPHFQPIISTTTATPVCVEALVRWNHPVRGLLHPAAFIPQVAELGLMDLMTMAVLRHGARDIARWRERGIDLSLSVNVEIASLEDETFPLRMEETLAEAGITPASVILEITERSAIACRPTSLESLARVRLQGFRLAIDDFGTGHSSFEQLDAFPFDDLKIDRQFVSRLGMSKSSEHIVRSIIDLAHGLGARVVAEGIETYEQLQLLGRYGCDKVQGYLISEPQSSEQMEATLLRLKHA